MKAHISSLDKEYEAARLISIENAKLLQKLEGSNENGSVETFNVNNKEHGIGIN